MANTVSVVAATVTLGQVQTALTTVAGWYDQVRCSPQTPLISAAMFRDYVRDPDVVAALVRDDTSAVIGAALCQKSTSQVLWLMAVPGQFGPVAVQLCAFAKANGITPWGVVGSDAVRKRFTDSGLFALAPERGPQAITYTGT